MQNMKHIQTNLFDRLQNIFFSHFSIFCGCIALFIYELTNARGFFWGDAGEFIAVSNILGIGHAYGHPLFWLLGRISILMNPSNPSAAMNHLTALFSAMTCTVIALLAQSWCRSQLSKENQSIVILSVTGIYCTAFTIWTQATFIEVYNVQAFFIALSIYFFDRYMFHNGNNQTIWASAYFFGIGMTLGMYIVILLPFAIFQFIRKKQTKNLFRNCLLITLFFLFGLSVWLYLPLRSLPRPPFLWSNIHSFRSFIVYLARTEAEQEGVAGLQYVPFYFLRSIKIFFLNFHFFGLFLLGFSLFYSIKNSNRPIYFYLLTTVLTFLIYSILLPLVLNFRQLVEMDVYLIPVFIIATPFLTTGAIQLYLLLKNNRRLILIAPVLLIAAVRWHDIDISKDKTADQFISYLTNHLPVGSHIVPASNAIGHSIYYAMFGLGNPNQYTVTHFDLKLLNAHFLDSLSGHNHLFIENNFHLLKAIDDFSKFRLAGPFMSQIEDSIYAKELETIFQKNFLFDDSSMQKLHPLDCIQLSPMWARRGNYWLNLLNSMESLNAEERNNIYEKVVASFYQAAAMDHFSYTGAYHHGAFALVLYDLNQLDYAESYAKRAIQIHPYAPHGYRAIYRIALKKNNPQKALNALEKLSHLLKEDGEIQLDLAQQYWNNHQKEKALKAYYRGRELGAKPREQLEKLLSPP
jgi:tetratricopeptide (TPR) repeat protein